MNESVYKVRRWLLLKEKVVAFFACAVVFGCVVAYTMFMLDAYNGDASCFFVKCVKVIK